MYFQTDKTVEEKRLFALKGPKEFCPSSPVCFKIFWMTKEILSFDVSILDSSSKELLFESEIKANQNASCSFQKKRKNKNKQKKFKKEDVMCSIVCADDDKDLISGNEYEIGATAKIVSTNSGNDSKNESTVISYQNLNPPLKFKIADDSTKYILSIKKRPRSFNITSDNKLKLKARIRSCEDENLNGTTNSRAELNEEKDLSKMNGRRNKPNSDDNLKGRKETPTNDEKQGKNKRNKNGKNGIKKNKKGKSKNDRRNKDGSSKKKNKRNKKGDKENSNKNGKANNRRKKNNMSKRFKV